MDIRTIKTFLGDDWGRFEAELQEVLHSDTKLLNEINSKILDNSGKQLRPMLSLLASRACGKVNDISLRCATASELIHTATLLHDDVADNSPLRRGVPTIMSLFGPSVSVLIGDYWLSRAMGLLVRCAANDIIAEFSSALGDLAEGEMLQMQKASTADTDMADYIRIITCKTASLFRASMVSGAYSVSASHEQTDAIRTYSLALGIAFQMRDDIFDYMPALDVGKKLGVDILEQKITIPLLEALSRCPYSEGVKIRDMVRNISSDSSARDMIVDFVNRYDGIEHSMRTLDRYVREAVVSLAPVKDSDEKDCLVALAHYVGERLK